MENNFTLRNDCVIFDISSQYYTEHIFSFSLSLLFAPLTVLKVCLFFLKYRISRHNDYLRFNCFASARQPF